MDYKKLYEETLRVNADLKKELGLLRSDQNGRNDLVREMIFKAFNSVSYLIAFNNLDTGEYVDVNDSFLSELGFRKEEVIGKTSADIKIFPETDDGNKYFSLTSRLKRIKEYPVTLITKEGKEKQYLYSAETVQLNGDRFLLAIFDENSVKTENHEKILDEIIETVSSYLAIFRVDSNDNLIIVDLNRKVEETESVSKKKIKGKLLYDTPLAKKKKLVELLNKIRMTGDANKLSSSLNGDDSDGFYMGFPLSSGNIVVTWEPGIIIRIGA